MHRLWLLISLFLLLPGCDDEDNSAADQGAPDARVADAASAEDQGAEPRDLGGPADATRDATGDAAPVPDLGVADSAGPAPDACPVAAELCNGQDDDCDGEIDEAFPGLGEPCPVGQGACAAEGVLVCDPRGGATLCAGVSGTPEVEACDAVDNDCDGAVDEGVEQVCFPGDEAAAGRGLCRPGRAACEAGQLGPCVGARGPTEEACNGADDDCDGMIDEDFPDLGEDCVVGVGACAAAGTRVCSPGADALVCAAASGLPQPEACNGADDDCDGMTDEDAAETCYGGPPDTVGVGQCRAGQAACAAGVVGACVGDVGPGEEVCNGLDDDCDGRTDEGPDGGSLRQACYRGPAGTAGVGRCREGEQACVLGAFGPCDDQGPLLEICDAEDNDCNGAVDDVPGDCRCLPGAVRDCYTGPDGTQDVGDCGAGRQVCAEDGLAWGPCVDESVPADERCDGLDNDCDGVADEALLGLDIVCRVGLGACQAEGLTRCDPQRAGLVCDAAPQEPEVERCDGADNDCDGQIDEGFALGEACEAGVGACAAVGRTACVDGALGCDARPVAPGPERCDGGDDDCDGRVDEELGLGEACEVGVGACRNVGQRVCDGAGGIGCDVGPGPPQEEICDGLDNDCDGAVDEADPRADEPCDTGLAGVCAAGRQRCLNAALDCVREAEPADELCDGLDNDCDGLDDEDEDGAPLQQLCYEGPPGTEGVGACVGGVQVCEAGRFGACVGQSTPEAETCNRADDDCDGDVDNLAVGACACEPGAVRPCYSGPAGTAGVGVCREGQQICADTGLDFGPCEGEVRPDGEVCDGLDNDCDGAVDDVPGVGAPCAVGVGQCRRDGQLDCDGDALACDAEPGPAAAEICDRLDNDCDGQFDELEQLGQACTVGVGGCAAEGIRVCDHNERTVVCTAEPGAPAPGDTCAGDIDEDCDGRLDEGDDCDANATCVGDDALVCQCGPDYQGDGNTCAVVDDCAPEPCANGECVDGVEAFSCDCAGSGYRGELCDEDIDECAEDLDNCDADQTCYNQPGSFSCDCDPPRIEVDGQCLPCPADRLRLFAEPDRRIASGIESLAFLAAVDLDGDGDPDVLSASSALGQVFWLENRGADGFAPAATVVTAPGVEAAVTLDIDQDGDQDIVTSVLNGRLRAWRNLGAARFEAIEAPLTPELARASQFLVVDLDGDGLLDLVYSDRAGEPRLMWLRAVPGGLADPQQLAPLPEAALSLVADDVDGDGDADLMLGFTGPLGVWLLRNDGGALSDPELLDPDQSSVTALATGDMDQDGDVDLLAFTLANEPTLYFENVDGALQAGAAVPFSFRRLLDGALADLDGDGILDLLATQLFSGAVLWQPGRGGNNFRGNLTLTDTLVEARALDVADFNGDGHLDVVVLAPRDRTIEYFENDGTAAFRGLALTRFPRAIASTFVDVDSNGALDLVLYDQDESTLVARQLGPENEFEAPRVVAEDIVVADLITAHLNDDEWPDVIVATTRGIDRVVWYPGTADGLAPVADVGLLGPAGRPRLLVGDLDGDRDNDLVLYDADLPDISWLENRGLEGFAAARRITLAPGALDEAALADINGDGLVDFAFIIEDRAEVAWYPNLGGGAFGPAQLVADDITRMETLELGDVDNDGDIDLVVNDEQNREIAIFPNAGDGSFDPRRNLPAPSLPYTARLADVNGDGLLDVIYGANGRLGWFRQRPDGEFARTDIDIGGSFFRQVGAADIDANGTVDVLFRSTDSKLRLLRGFRTCAPE